MKTKAMKAVALAVMLLIAPGAFAQSEGASENKPIAPKLDGMGKHKHPVTTDSKEAQRFFNQGIVLAFGFNHAEAARSFREAARLDPDLAMAYWGIAYVLGPNINAPMNPDHNKDAMEALHKAISLKDKASEKERAYIDALSKRYVDNPPEDRSALDLAYADAMREVAKNYPEDQDAQILFAEALMDTMPWDYWEANGDPKPATKEVLAALEGVLEKNPKHPQALHLYIHTVEKVHPEKAEEVADRLVNLVPGASHLVHMPGHIFIRLGRYKDTIDVNLDAVKADEDYVTACRKQELYPLAYMPHNEHFINAAAMLEGRRELAVKWANSIDEGAVESGQMCHPSFGILQHFHVTPLFTYVRFGMWDEVLNEPKPEAQLLYPIGVWHFSRGMAYARTGKTSEAQKELAALKDVAKEPKAQGVTMFDVNRSGQILDLAVEVLAGEVAATEKNYDGAIAHLQKAVEMEDALLYSEPEDWPNPARLNLGAVQLEAGKAADAEKTFRENLQKYPNNGWGLFGLQQSLEAQGKTDEAKEIAKQFKRAWKRADVELASARF